VQHYIWKWIFWDGGRQIAYKDGSPRFTMRCVLVHSKTTLELENYDCFSELPKNAPLWLESLEKVHQSAFSPQLRYTADRSLPVHRLLFNTSAKELQTLRIFFGFCLDRKWATENVARRIKSPRNIKPNDVVPFTALEVGAILKACSGVGRAAYERARTKAMVLTLRYTALRIGDVAMLARDRISMEGDRWRIFLRTEKNGQPVFLPVPTDMKTALDAVPIPRGTIGESRYFFWSGNSSEKALKAVADRSLRTVFKASGIPNAHAHRFRHTLATELLGSGASFEEVADILGNSPEIVRKHYAKWSPARQARIDELMEQTHFGVLPNVKEKPTRIH